MCRSAPASAPHGHVSGAQSPRLNARLWGDQWPPQDFVDRLIDDVIAALGRDRRFAGLSARDLQLLLEDVSLRASEQLKPTFAALDKVKKILEERWQ
jgi:hypothetical protein